MECEVDLVLCTLRSLGQVPRLDRVLEACAPVLPEPPRLQPLVVDLRDYDELLSTAGVPA
jgi:hypothetical protein